MLVNKKNDDEKAEAFLKNTMVYLDLGIRNPKDSTVIQERDRHYLGSAYPDVYFTPREMDCAKVLLKEQTIKEMAHSMGISPRSVEFYLRNMRFKLGVDSKKELCNSIRDKTNIFSLEDKD